MIAVVDYGMGNLRSVEKALEFVGAKVKVASKPSEIVGCDKLVLPGVGAFGDAMGELKKLRLIDPIKDVISRGKPFLGLCLGMQLLFDASDEAPGVKGLSVLRGGVKKFKPGKERLKVPHMGWNSIAIRAKGSNILRSISNGSYVYFVHSYYVKPEDRKVIFTTTDYGIEFVSGIRRDNIYGFQFHPEKSQALGLRILRNFVKSI